VDNEENTMAVSIEKAALYEKYRLPYPPELADDLFEQIGDVKTIADIGAGTGQLARLFADRCTKLYAVEPEDAMRQVAADALAGFETVEIRDGSAELTTLEDHLIDLIVVGNAFHRFKPDASEEFRRILNHDGWIALIWYNYTHRAFTDLLFPKLAQLNGGAPEKAMPITRLSMEDVFGDADIHTLHYRQSYAEDWAAFWGMACAGIEAPERDDPMFARFEALNREVFDTLAVDGTFVMEYETHVSFGQPTWHNDAMMY
jgi:SAM-dependent methyltransferase